MRASCPQLSCFIFLHKELQALSNNSSKHHPTSARLVPREVSPISPLILPQRRKAQRFPNRGFLSLRPSQQSVRHGSLLNKERHSSLVPCSRDSVLIKTGSSVLLSIKSSKSRKPFYNLMWRNRTMLPWNLWEKRTDRNSTKRARQDSCWDRRDSCANMFPQEKIWY